MSTPHLYGAVFALIFNEKGQILLLQRKNTGYFDGGRCLVTGHIEPGEAPSDALYREVQEEVGLDVTNADVFLQHIAHRFSTSGRTYVEISYEIAGRTGTPNNMEVDKCSEIKRFDLEDLPEYMPPENQFYIQAYLENDTGYSELDFRSH